MNKSDLFKRYNILKQDSQVFARFDLVRLNKALGIAQRKTKETKYHTTMDSCTCPDQSHRGIFVCKHRLAVMLSSSEWIVRRFDGDPPWDELKGDQLK